ncbi:MAG: hypothetical protein IKS83_01995 [Victivallales bacterium]|nr:hypothetical protein [Victivallales bacterium]
MKNQQRKSCFTLVEVLIAMGICVVGVVSIMGLFPVGANTARDANMAFYADQAADQMLHFTKFAVLEDSSSTNAVFLALTGFGSNINSSSGYTAQSKPGGAAEPADWSTVDSVADNAAFSGLTEQYVKMLANSGTEIKAHGTSVYRVGFFTHGDDDDYEDFACVVRMWATPVFVDEMAATPSHAIPRAATFHLEVSWPAELPYARRQTAEYAFDVFVPEG